MPVPAVAAAAAPSLLSWFATPTGIGLSTLAGLATTGYFMAGGGQPGEEEQERMLRRQLEIQDEFEQQRAQRGGAGGDMAGLVGGMGPVRPQPSLAMLAEEDEFLRDLLSAQEGLERIERAGAQSAQFSPELQKLLAGEEARIRQLQSERTLTPYEILQLVGL